jgi:putative ubiquitin-RnfH superfamily antitoxin RatB of RatAB toxin-antitoxin module
MELRELITKSHDLHEQLKQLQAQEAGLKEQIKALETQIKLKLDETGAEYENLTEEEFQLMMAELGDPMMLSVEVVYATKSKQIINEVQLARGATVEDGIVLSGILDKCTDIDLKVNKVGIHGTIKPLTEILSDGDRIEIYRPVTAKV